MADPWLEKSFREKSVPYYIPVQTVKKPSPDHTQTVMKKEYPLGRLIFVQTELHIEKFVERTQGLQRIYLDHATGRCATVGDGTMDAFRAFMENKSSQCLFLKDPYSKFTKNQKVRVLRGDFAGQEGRIVRIRKNNRLVLQLGNFAVAIFGTDPSSLEIIE